MSRPEASVLALALAAGCGLALAAYAVARPVFGAAASRLQALLAARGRRARLADMPAAVRRFFQEEAAGQDALPPWARRWLALAERRLAKAGVRVPVGRYAAGTILAAASGIGVGLWFLNNLPAALVLAAAAFLVPDTWLAARIQARRRKMIDQLAAAVRLFAAELADTPHVQRALARIAPNVPPPLGTVLRRAADDLTTGTDRAEVFKWLMEELDFDYGRMFVMLMQIAWDDAAARPLFSRLAMRVGSLQALIRTGQKEVALTRAMAMALNALTLPMFFFVRAAIPGGAEFLTGHPLGRFLVFLCFASVLVGMLVDRAMSEVSV